MKLGSSDDTIWEGIAYAARIADRRRKEVMQKFKVGELENHETQNSVSDKMSRIDFEERANRRTFEEIK